MKIDPLVIMAHLKLHAKERKRLIALFEAIPSYRDKLSESALKDIEEAEKSHPHIVNNLKITNDVLKNESHWHWFDIGEIETVCSLLPIEDLRRSSPGEQIPFPFTFVTGYHEHSAFAYFLVRIDEFTIEATSALLSEGGWKTLGIKSRLVNDGTSWSCKYVDTPDNDLLGEIITLSLMKVLRCKNVSVVKERVAPALIKVRQRRGGFGGYTRHILTVNGTEATKHTGMATGAGGQKRLHFRRGHIRRLAKGTIWVTECMVGKPQLGFVDKSYRVEHNK